MGASFSVQYIFSLIDQFTGRAGVMGRAATALSGQIHAAGAAMTAFSRVATMAGAAVGAASLVMVSSGVKAAAKFEDKLAEVRKVVPNMTKEMMWELGNEVMTLSAKSAVASDQVAEIFASGARMGIRGTKALSTFADTVVKVAAAWDGVSAQMAAESLATISGKFFSDLGAEEAQQRMISVADAINYLGQNTAGVKNVELLKFFQNAGADFSKIGVTAEEAAAYGAIAMKAGQPSGFNEGTRASSTMNRLLLAATAPLKTPKGKLTKAGQAFQALGLTQAQYSAMLKSGGTDALLGIMEKVKGMDVEKRTRLLANLLGDARAARQVSNIAGQLNEYKRSLAQVSDEYAKRFVREKEFMDWMDKAYPAQAKALREMDAALHHGSVDQEFNARLDTLYKQMDRFAEARNNLMIAIGKPWLPMLQGSMGWLADATDGLRQFISANEDLGFALTAGGLAAGAAAFGNMALNVIKYMTGITSSWAILRALGAGVLKFTIMMAVVGAGVWIYENWEKLKKAFAEPTKVNLIFPKEPEWLQWLIRNAAETNQRASASVDNARQDVESAKNWVKSWFGATDEPIAMPERNPKSWVRGGRANDPTYSPREGMPWLPSAAIPQSMSVTTQVNPIQINPATISVQVSGTVNGPVTGTGSGQVSAQPALGTSTVSAGAPAPAGGQ